PERPTGPPLGAGIIPTCRQRKRQRRASDGSRPSEPHAITRHLLPTRSRTASRCLKRLSWCALDSRPRRPSALSRVGARSRSAGADHQRGGGGRWRNDHLDHHQDMPNTKLPCAYLDNNIVSAIAKDDEPAESDALDRLLEAKDEGKVCLVTSELTLREIKGYQGRMRPQLVRTFRLLEKVEIVRWDKLVGMHSYGDHRTWITTPLIDNEPDYSALLALGLKTVDAQHVFVAAKQACDA